MKYSYAIRHAVYTLLIAPFIWFVFIQLFRHNNFGVTELIVFYLPVVFVSFVFSLPTLLVYAISFHFLSKNVTQVLLSKSILITISVLGILITIWVIFKEMDLDIAISYSITTVAVGLVLKSKTPGMKPPQEDINYI